MGIILPAMANPTVIFARQSAADTEATDLESQVIAACCDTGLSVIVIPHLYHIANDSPIWRTLAQPSAAAVVLLSWLHPRAAEWVLHSHQLAPQHLAALNLATFTSATQGMKQIEQAVAAVSKLPPIAGQGEVVNLDDSITTRWYPVVDRSRCTNCHHCLQFCLFGVYTAGEKGELLVSHPDQCKAGCPACSRICPNGAIIFPLYEKSDAIAGAPGQLMSPDLPARRMFYARTGQPCTVCGNKLAPGAVPTAGQQACPECGGPVSKTSPPATPPPPSSFDDLDKLVDQLDQTMQRRG